MVAVKMVFVTFLGTGQDDFLPGEGTAARPCVFLLDPLAPALRSTFTKLS